MFCSFVVDPVTDTEVTTADTTTGDYQTTIADELTTATSPMPYYISELQPVKNSETKSREYSHQGMIDYCYHLFVCSPLCGVFFR